jgi:hypothetical protein
MAKQGQGQRSVERLLDSDEQLVDDLVPARSGRHPNGFRKPLPGGAGSISGPPESRAGNRGNRLVGPDIEPFLAPPVLSLSRVVAVVAVIVQRDFECEGNTRICRTDQIGDKLGVDSGAIVGASISAGASPSRNHATSSSLSMLSM